MAKKKKKKARSRPRKKKAKSRPRKKKKKARSRPRKKKAKSRPRKKKAKSRPKAAKKKRKAPSGGLDLKAMSREWKSAGKPMSWPDWIRRHQLFTHKRGGPAPGGAKSKSRKSAGFGGF